MVLLGKIVQINARNYKIEVKEIFKGEVSSKILTGIYSDDIKYDINSCAFFPGQKGEYLLYLKEIKNDNHTYYYTDHCLANRTIDLKDCPVMLIQFDKSELITETENWIAKLRNK